jgi:hypothetical protein
MFEGCDEAVVPWFKSDNEGPGSVGEVRTSIFSTKKFLRILNIAQIYSIKLSPVLFFGSSKKFQRKFKEISETVVDQDSVGSYQEEFSKRESCSFDLGRFHQDTSRPQVKFRRNFREFSGKILMMYRDKLPVVTKEMGDTWIYGVPSDPAKVRIFLENSHNFLGIFFVHHDVA